MTHILLALKKYYTIHQGTHSETLKKTDHNCGETLKKKLRNIFLLNDTYMSWETYYFIQRH